MIGIQAVANLARYCVILACPDAFGITDLVGSLVLWTGFYLYAILHCTERRWKMAFVLIAATHVAASILIELAVFSIGTAAFQTLSMGIHLIQQLLVTLAVAAVATIDIRQPQRYPWTHWVGILLILWQLVGRAVIATEFWIR